MRTELSGPFQNETRIRQHDVTNNERLDVNKRIENPDIKQNCITETEHKIGTKENPISIITKNEALEDDRHPITGVEFKQEVVKTPEGEYIKGVFPQFEKKFEAQIPKELYREGDKKQFAECNKQLYEKIEKDPDFKKVFSEEQIEQIKDGMKDGSAPDGYVWHHEAQTGKISLVNSEVHAKTGHDGGRRIWGGGTECR